MSANTKYQQSSKFSLATIGTIIGMIGGLLTILFVLFPVLEPAKPPAVMGATLSDITMEYNISLRDFVNSSGAAWKIDINDFADQELEEIGNVVHFTAEIEGFKNKNCTLQWSVFDADTQSRVPGQTNRFWTTLTPEAAADRISEGIWVPFPPTQGDFFVRLNILDENGLSIASGDSEVFTFR